MINSILYIEDDPIDIQLLLRSLKDYQIEINVVNSFEDAIEVQRDRTYDLLLTDITVGCLSLDEEISNLEYSNIIVLSNNPSLINLPNITVYEKPFKIEYIQEYIELEPTMGANLDQIEELCSGDEKAMVDLLKTLVEGIDDTKMKLKASRQKRDYGILIGPLHNVLGKLAIINLEDERKIIMDFENKLRENGNLEDSELDVIGKILQRSSFFVHNKLLKYEVRNR